MKQDNNRPQGIPFYSVKSGDTHFARSGAQVQAYVNSSDMGINSSRGQDYGWRLAADWVKKVKEYRRDENKMEALDRKFGGRKVTDVQVLTAIYGAQMRVYDQRREDEDSPFEEKYLQDISSQPKPAFAQVTDDPKTTNEVKDASTDPSGNNTRGATYTGEGTPTPALKKPTTKKS